MTAPRLATEVAISKPRCRDKSRGYDAPDVADVAVSVCDVIGLIMQGDAVGDVPRVVSDVTPWARHGMNNQRMVDEALTSFPRMADDAALAPSTSVTVAADGARPSPQLLMPSARSRWLTGRRHSRTRPLPVDSCDGLDSGVLGAVLDS